MNNYIKHYGVLGMKWGVRRKKTSTISTTNSTSRKKSVSELSDEELRRAINRHNLEQQYKKIPASQKSAGSKFVKDVLTNAAKQTVTTYTAKYMAKGMEAIIKEATKKVKK